MKRQNLPLSAEYKQKVNDFKFCVVQSRVNNNVNKIAQAPNKSKAIWNIVNSKIKIHSISSNIKLLIDGKLIQDLKENANHLLDTFLLDFEHVNFLDPQLSQITSANHQMFLTPTDPLEVKKIILNLPNSFSVGPDEIPTSLIKSCVDIICEPLSDLINEIFITGIFPDCFKIAKIIPLYKKGSKLDPSNYRPLVIQNIFSKIVEKALSPVDLLIIWSNTS